MKEWCKPWQSQFHNAVKKNFVGSHCFDSKILRLKIFELYLHSIEFDSNCIEIILNFLFKVQFINAISCETLIYDYQKHVDTDFPCPMSLCIPYKFDKGFIIISQQGRFTLLNDRFISFNSIIFLLPALNISKIHIIVLVLMMFRQHDILWWYLKPSQIQQVPLFHYYQCSNAKNYIKFINNIFNNMNW